MSRPADEPADVADVAGRRAERLLRWSPRHPFLPGVQPVARALPRETGGEAPVASFSDGCHDGSFFTAQEPPSLAFLARRLSGESGGQGEARDRST